MIVLRTGLLPLQIIATLATILRNYVDLLNSPMNYLRSLENLASTGTLSPRNCPARPGHILGPMGAVQQQAFYNDALHDQPPSLLPSRPPRAVQSVAYRPLLALCHLVKF